MPSLTNVEIQIGPATELIFEWDGEIGQHNVVLWSVFIIDPDGNSQQFGYKLVDGQPSAQFIFDHTKAQQTNFEIDADSTSRVLRLTYQGGASELADRDRFDYAVLTIDGVDVSRYEPPPP